MKVLLRLGCWYHINPEDPYENNELYTFCVACSSSQDKRMVSVLRPRALWVRFTSKTDEHKLMKNNVPKKPTNIYPMAWHPQVLYDWNVEFLSYT
jgi:hypothetical protein